MKGRLTKTGILVVEVNGTTLRLTKRQRWGLTRIGGDHPVSPDLAKQLIGKGLASKFNVHERVEWNRVVATLWVCLLTPLGEAALLEVSK